MKADHQSNSNSNADFLSESEFQRSEDKKEGESLGYVAKHKQTEKMYYIKYDVNQCNAVFTNHFYQFYSNSESHKYYKNGATKSLIGAHSHGIMYEYVASPFYSTLLGQYTPKISLIKAESSGDAYEKKLHESIKPKKHYKIRYEISSTFVTLRPENPKQPLLVMIGSSYIDNFVPFKTLRDNGHFNVNNFAGMLACSYFCGEYDINSSNFGAILDDNKYRAAKVDHGYSLTSWFTNPYILLKNLYSAIDRYKYNSFNLTLVEFKSAVTNITTKITSEFIKEVIKRRVDDLERYGYEPVHNEMKYWEDDILHNHEEFKENNKYLVKSFSELAEYFVLKLKMHLKVFQELGNVLELLSKIERPRDNDRFHNITWFKYAAVSHVDIAKTYDCKIEGLDAEAWLSKNPDYKNTSPYIFRRVVNSNAIEVVSKAL